MPQTAPTVIITGSSSRQPTRPSRIPFGDTKLTDGAQRSHTIPQQVFNGPLADLFSRIGKAQLPDGGLPFDPDNFLDNGQALPSNNSSANGLSIFDLSQHKGSHPQVNAMMQDRLQPIYDDLIRDLADAPTPEARNLALIDADAKVRNIADAMAAIGVGGAADPNRPELRAVYNRADPNARVIWRDWGSLTDAEKNLRIRQNLDDLMGRFVDQSGNLTTAGESRLKVFRDLTQGSVGALTPDDAIIADNILAHMEARGIDPTKVDAAAYLDIHKADLVPATGELAERAEKISAARTAGRIAARIGTKVVVGALALLDLYDYADTGGRIVAYARGDAQFAPTLDEDKHFSGVNYLADSLLDGNGVVALGVLTTLTAEYLGSLTGTSEQKMGPIYVCDPARN